MAKDGLPTLRHSGRCLKVSAYSDGLFIDSNPPVLARRICGVATILVTSIRPLFPMERYRQHTATYGGLWASISQE
ncbi:hypothetical protein BDR06DRAFT_964954 [Suillus hirtellus]|nr:hypothetical protein BDR06DRAFT_964954 [Suillus hirtellus]